jgi:hypothetical protein
LDLGVRAALVSYSIPHYFNSFYFWLDMVATFSFVVDIPWIYDLLMSNDYREPVDLEHRYEAPWEGAHVFRIYMARAERTSRCVHKPYGCPSGSNKMKQWTLPRIFCPGGGLQFEYYPLPSL